MKTRSLKLWTARVPSGFIATLPTQSPYDDVYTIAIVGHPAKGVALVEYARVDGSWLVARASSVGEGNPLLVGVWTLKHIQVDVDHAVSRLRGKIKDYRDDRAREKKVKAAADAQVRKEKG